MPDQPAGPAPGQLGDVRVLLLRAASSCRWRRHRPDPRSRTPRSTTAPSPRPSRERWTPIRARSKRASATKSRSDTASREFSKRRREAQLRRHPVGVEGQRRAGQGAGAERRDVEPAAGVDQAVDVAGEGPAVGQQMVGQQDRLGPLEVGVAGQVDVLRLLGPPRGGPAGDPGSDRRRPRSSRLANNRRSVAT